MKNNTQPQFYFSAYPLKVIGTTTETDLKVSKPKTSNGMLKVLPVTDKTKNNGSSVSLNDKHFNDIENMDISWYNNYE